MPDETPIDKNKAIWDQVFDPPKEFCSEFHPNGDTSKTLTAIAAVWYFEVATEMWGPIGQGWGFEIVDDRLIHDGKGQPVLHVVMVKVWYTEPKIFAPDTDLEKRMLVERNTFGVGCTQMQLNDSKGQAHWDDEFNKKTLTDAITNALSRLGFGAEVRKKSYGKYDDRGTTGLPSDPEMVKAWNEYIAAARAAYPEVAKTMSDLELCNRVNQRLIDNQREATPDTLAEEVRRLAAGIGAKKPD